SAPTPIALRVAYASASASNIPVLTAAERGLFREQGLDVEMVLLQGSRTDQAVGIGETPVGFGASVLTARMAGADLVAVAPLVNAADLGLPFLQGTVGANTTFAREQPEVVRRVLRTYVSAVALARRDGEAAKAALGKYTQTDDAEVLDDSYRYFRDLWGRPD